MTYPIFPEITGFSVTAYFKDEEYKQQFKTEHWGIDLAYQKKHYSGTRYIMSIADGEVTYVKNPANAKKLKWVNITHKDLIPGKWVISRYFHFNEISVKKGQTVKLGEYIGVEGTSGYVTGSHLELQVWVVPIGYTYKDGDNEKYAVNPLDYIYLHDGQECFYDPKGEVKKMPEYIETPCKEGTKFKCLKADALNYRTTPEIRNDNKCGLLPNGEYEAVATVENDGYTWCKFLIAGTVERYATVQDGYSELVDPMNYEKLYNDLIVKYHELEEYNDRLSLANQVLNDEIADITSAITFLSKYIVKE